VTVAVAVENRSGWAFDESAAVEVVRSAFTAETVDDGEVGVTLVAPAEMAELNASHRGKPVPTDVLSFPIDGRDQLAEGLPRQLGDIVICPHVAVEEGTPVAVLLVHAVLHLVGYDHEGADSVMLDRQDVLVKEVVAVAVSPA
jgi:probable rRNA maturation factor